MVGIELLDEILDSFRDTKHEFKSHRDNVYIGAPNGKELAVEPIDPPDWLLKKLGIEQIDTEKANLLINIINGDNKPTPSPNRPDKAPNKATSESISSSSKSELTPSDFKSFDLDLVASIKSAAWKVIDIETTGLTASSKPVKLTKKELEQGFDTTLRPRIVTVTYRMKGRLNTYAFDMDLMNEKEKSALADACLSKCVIGHNVGFDIDWLAGYTQSRPSLVVDTMLLARALNPEFILEVAQATDDRTEEKHPMFTLATSIFKNKMAGLWSLETLVAFKFGVMLDKTFQKPKNWTNPNLTEEHFEYATGDTEYCFKLLCLLLDITEDDNPIAAYEEVREQNPALKIIEPQVLDVVEMRQKGIPVDREEGHNYAESKFDMARELTQEMVKIEPSLAPYSHIIADANKGLTSDLKKTLCEAFEARGIQVRRTKKTGEPQVGEKDLRLAGAENSDEARPLFDLWVKINKAQKAAKMALEFIGFAERSKDSRVHPLISHGPQTGRLSSQEPNSQQAPREQGYRNIVRASKGKKIAACDFSALDMRVGSALCIRTQLDIKSRFESGKLSEDIREAVDLAINETYTDNELKRQIELIEKELKDAIEDRRWDAKDRLNRDLLLTRLTYRYQQVLRKARESGEETWSALRDAFRLGVDIHTFTAIGMEGGDPSAEFEGLDGDRLAEKQAVWKERLGFKRQSGKVANLGLSYAMKAPGFKDYAAKIFNIHFTLEEAEEVRNKWLDTYPEVDLWHIWTELNPAGIVWVPDADSKGKRRPKPYFETETLGGRKLVTFGLNAALAYPDQGTGADILGVCMHTMRKYEPELFSTIINQVHDEVVFEIPDEKVKTYERLIPRIMKECGDRFTMRYGVPIDATLEIDDVWLKG